MEEEGPGSSKSSLTKEQRERMERNRMEAKRRLLEKSGAVQEVLAAYKIQDHLAAQAGQPTLKKQKTGLEQRMENDLQNAVSTGTIVRIQGTKLIDTGGGFLLEEKDTVIPEEEVINVVREPAAVAPTDMPRCLECKIDFSESFLYKHFDHKVCDACKDIDEKHSYITRTDAKNDYLLKDVDLDKREPLLKFLLRPNPHNPRWGDLKLYLRLQEFPRWVFELETVDADCIRLPKSQHEIQGIRESLDHFVARVFTYGPTLDFRRTTQSQLCFEKGGAIPQAVMCIAHNHITAATGNPAGVDVPGEDLNNLEDIFEAALSTQGSSNLSVVAPAPSEQIFNEFNLDRNLVVTASNVDGGFVEIREFRNDADGSKKPGQGIRLNRQQWKTLKELTKFIDGSL